MKKFLLFLCAMSLVFGVVGIANANLIENGSFESPVVTNPKMWDTFNSIPDWNNSGPVEYQQHGLGGGWFAAHGEQWVELDASASYILSQGFVTIVDQTYTVTFAFSPRPRPDKAEEVFYQLQYGVGYDSDSFDDYYSISGDGGGLSMPDWEYYSFYFTADSTFSYILFTDTGADDGYGSFLDDVSVNPVPEPATMLLLGSGLIGLAAFGRKKFFKKS